MPKSSFSAPPIVFGTEFEELNVWLQEVFHHLYGLDTNLTGVLDENNFSDTGFGTLHDAISGGHSSVQQATDPTDVIETFISTIDETADSSYSANEQTLINDLKEAVNTLIAVVDGLEDKLNTLMANQRTAGQLA